MLVFDKKNGCKIIFLCIRTNITFLEKSGMNRLYVFNICFGQNNKALLYEIVLFI